LSQVCYQLKAYHILIPKVEKVKVLKKAAGWLKRKTLSLYLPIVKVLKSVYQYLSNILLNSLSALGKNS